MEHPCWRWVLSRGVSGEDASCTWCPAVSAIFPENVCMAANDACAGQPLQVSKQPPKGIRTPFELQAYAMTEAAHQMTSNPLPPAEHRPGSVGQAQGSVSVAILDPVCTVLGPGQVGEVCIRGPNVTAGYRHNPAANEEAFAGGWFHTGDSGVLDEGGYLTLVGRLKELINRGGEKISPIEVGTKLGRACIVECRVFSLSMNGMQRGMDVACKVLQIRGALRGCRWMGCCCLTQSWQRPSLCVHRLVMQVQVAGTGCRHTVTACSWSEDSPASLNPPRCCRRCRCPPLQTPGPCLDSGQS